MKGEVVSGCWQLASNYWLLNMTSTEAYQSVIDVIDMKQRRDQMILDELPQVHYIARRIHERLPQHIAFEDLVNAGVLGLIEAMQKFDPSREVQLKSFAKFRIRGAILDSLRELDWGSRPLRRKGREIEEAITKLSAKLGRQPTESEIAEEMNIDISKLHQLLAQLDGLELVGQQSDSDVDRSDAQDLIESAKSGDPDAFELFARGETKQHLAQAIGGLGKNEQLVISLYYQEELTMKEVAAVLNVTESRVSQIHSLALAKLEPCSGT